MVMKNIHVIPTEEPKQDYKKLSEEFTQTLKSIPDDVLIKYAEPRQETIEQPVKDLAYWKTNAEEDYMTTPISVLRYITELENGMYSEEEVIEILLNFRGENPRYIEDWFNQFKKQKS